MHDRAARSPRPGFAPTSRRPSAAPAEQVEGIEAVGPLAPRTGDLGGPQLRLDGYDQIGDDPVLVEHVLSSIHRTCRPTGGRRSPPRSAARSAAGAGQRGARCLPRGNARRAAGRSSGHRAFGREVNDELRAITNSHDTRDRPVIRSSASPSAKYACSGSPLMFSNGSTATDGPSRHRRRRPMDLPQPCSRQGLSASRSQSLWPSRAGGGAIASVSSVIRCRSGPEHPTPSG